MDDGKPTDAASAKARIQGALDRVLDTFGDAKARAEYLGRPMEEWPTSQLIGLMVASNLWALLRTADLVPEPDDSVQDLLVRAIDAELELNFRLPTDAELAKQAADDTAIANREEDDGS